MIIGNIKNRARYASLGEDIMQALEYFASVLEKPEDAPKEFADIPLPGGKVLIRVRPLNTVPMEKGVMEAHYKELDIHFVASGEEKMALSDVSALRLTKEDPDNDVYFLEGEMNTIVTLTPGTFVIAYPEDAHMGCIAVNEPMPIVKMIAKMTAEKI
ncbi:MAG: DUF386 domain-containing protein [Ruminococcaceae bacterium]|nr:DUF386 domain-containing protein [Oscillospiraceae bacterium]